MLLANDVLHSNFSKITFLAAFDLLLFLLLVSLTDVVKKAMSLITAWRIDTNETQMCEHTHSHAQSFTQQTSPWAPIALQQWE